METISVLIRIPPREIAFLTFILESYEGIAVIRTLNSNEGIVELMVSPQQINELRDILRDLEREFTIDYLT